MLSSGYPGAPVRHLEMAILRAQRQGNYWLDLDVFRNMF